MKIRRRNQWGATVPLAGSMILPARGVFVHHSVTDFDDTLDSSMRTIEDIGRRRFGRMSYNYGGHRSGVAEGAGTTVGAHTGGHAASDGTQWNRVALGYVFVGNFQHDKLTDRMVEDFGTLCRAKVAAGQLVPDFFISPHRDVVATACPGHDVLARWNDLVAAATQAPPNEGEPVMIDTGSRSQAVKDLQSACWLWVDQSIVVDGIFGPITAAASRKLKAVVRDSCSKPEWINPATSAWSNRTWAMFGEWEDNLLRYLGAR